MLEKYLEVAGHSLYCYEWDNNGEAVVLLHGGLSQTSHWDAQVLPAIEDDFHVFGYDRTAHGFTGDREGSMHFDYQVKEAIAPSWIPSKPFCDARKISRGSGSFALLLRVG